jgi:hypothetical protein
MSDTDRIVEGSRKLANELAEDFGFSHAGAAVYQQGRHAVVRRVGQQFRHSSQDGLGFWITDPAVQLNTADTLII